MGAIEWFLVTSVLSALVATLVTYAVIDREYQRVMRRILEIEREVYKQDLDSIIDRIEKESSDSWKAQTRLPTRR